MRIIIVTNDFPAVSETFILAKVLKLAERKHTIIVVCNSFNKTEWEKINPGKFPVIIEEISSKKLRQFFIVKPVLWSLITNKKFRSKIILQKYFSQIIDKIKPDVIHFEFSGTGIQYTDILPNIKALKVVSCRGSAEKVKLLTDINRQEKIKDLFDKIDLIHCVSDDMKKTILPYCKDPSKIFINYPSIDTAVFKRSEIYKKNQTLHILSVGRLSFQKGYFTGLLAIKKLKETGLDFIWMIVGDGQQKEEIIFHINEMKLNENAELLGKKSRQEIIALYNKADIFFLPSVYEGIANAALEAMSMEIPVVATRSGGMEEVITGNENGLLADIYDFENLTACILHLSKNFDECLKLGVNGRKRVIEKFTLDNQIELFLEKYKTALLQKENNNVL